MVSYMAINAPSHSTLTSPSRTAYSILQLSRRYKSPSTILSTQVSARPGGAFLHCPISRNKAFTGCLDPLTSTTLKAYIIHLINHQQPDEHNIPRPFADRLNCKTTIALLCVKSQLTFPIRRHPCNDQRPPGDWCSSLDDPRFNPIPNTVLGTE